MEENLRSFANEFQTLEIRNSNLVNPRFSCPRLKELRILKCPTLSGVRLEGCSSLTELDFGMSMILERHLEVCLNDLMQAQAPLTVLKLNSCKNLAKFTIPNFPKLRQLDLQRTNVYDQALADILSLLPNLTHINVNYCIGLKNVRITDHPSLESISFSQCIHIFKIRITGCSRLREIDVSATALVVQELENLIRSNPQVLKWNFNRAYKFSNINLSQDSSEDEGKLMRLDTECFDCSYTEANDNSIDQITCASAGLKQLYLNQTSIVRPRIYSFSLQVLHLQGTSITGDILCDIVNHCPSLTTLDVQQCEGIANLGTLQLNSLEQFNISSVPIEDQAFQVILSQCPKLKSLEVAGCNGLTNIHLKHGSLEFLSVQRCMALAGLEISRETCPHLKLVDASSCEQLSSMRVQGYDKIYCETEKVKVHPGQGELKIITNNRNQQRMTVIQQ